MVVSTNVDHQVDDLQGNFIGSFLLAWLRESIIKFHSSLKSQGNISYVVVVIFAVIFLMQVFIYFEPYYYISAIYF